MPPSPFTATLIQSTLLNSVANILAQLIHQHQNHKSFTINFLALLQFTLHAIPVVPINFSWQRWLETRYPGFPSWRNRGTKPASDPEDLLPRKEKPARQPSSSSSGSESGMRNFAMKFLLDQTVGSVMNIVLFIVLINLLKGENLGRTWELVCEDFTPIMKARLKYRPVVSTMMYTVVPVDRRVVFGSACGVIWGVYLSLYAVV